MRSRIAILESSRKYFSCEIFRILRTADTLLVRSYLDLICEIERRLEKHKTHVSFPRREARQLEASRSARALVRTTFQNVRTCAQDRGHKMDMGKKRGRARCASFRTYVSDRREALYSGDIRKLVDCSVRLRCPTRNEPFYFFLRVMGVSLLPR